MRAFKRGRTVHLTILIVGLSLAAVLTGCGSNTLVDESGTVNSGSNWSREIILSSESTVSVNLSSSAPVALFAIDEHHLFDLHRAEHIGFGSITYLEDLSNTCTSNYSNSARLPAGKWTFVVLTSDFSHANLDHPMSASFSIKITGGPGSSAAGRSGGGGGGGGYSGPVPSAPPAPNIPSIQTPAIRTDQLPVAPPQQAPPPPPPPPLKLTFTSLDDALTTLHQGQTPERQAAVGYINQSPVVAARRPVVIDALLPLLQETAYDPAAAQALLKWAAKENASALRSALESLLGGDPATLNTRAAAKALSLAKLLLSWGDADTIPSALRLLRAPSAHDGAFEALVAVGASVEPEVLTAIPQSTDALTSRNLMDLLAKVGSEKSIVPLQDAMNAKDPVVARSAGDALNQIASRLKLKPDQYLFNLFNRYSIDPPTGFTADPTVTRPNTRSWTRQAPGRAAKSVYTVQVLHVARDFQLNPPPNAITIQAGALTFHGLEAGPSPQFTQAAHVAALDGDYLIDITAIVDTADNTAQTNMNNAVKKIKAK